MRQGAGRTATTVVGLVLLLAAGVRGESLRLATHNVERLGDPDADPGVPERVEWEALVAILERLDADVVLLQEISGADEEARVPRLGAAAGYPETVVSGVSGTLSGGLRTACLSRLPIVAARTRSWTAAELSESFGGAADPPANDISRDLFVVSVDAGGATPWFFFTLHLKSGASDENRFRRQVEVHRLLQAVELARADEPAAPVVLAGDFNEDPRDAPFAETWSAPPPGLPASYQLGSDIALPLAYEPFQVLSREDFTLVDATHEDAPALVHTRPASGRLLDLAWHDPTGAPCGAVVYESCLDDGIDAPPRGQWLPFAGLPPGCGVTMDASDHLPVVVELRRLPDDVRPAPTGPSLRVIDPGDAGAALITATLAWPSDAGAPRPPRDHFHVLRGTRPDALGRVGEEGLRDTSWIDATPRAAERPLVHHYRVLAADGCEQEE